ncbi:MAG: DUF4160 domain-containing protein [Candidatus Sumerlaeota bacterium]|nr:DUF4160 domain-containing protein [Candidatus Sumerlaeota bacterium]
MPIIACFYGISIRMYFKEHGIAHIHAAYGGYNGVFAIQTSEIIEGSLPHRAEKMVKAWTRMHQIELMNMWKTQQFNKLPGLE